MNLEDIDSLPSRPFKGFDCSLHFNVQRLIVVLFGEYEAWYRGKNPGGRLRDPEKVKRHLTHFVLEAYRTYRAIPGLLLGIYRSNAYYNKSNPDRYHPKHLSFRIVNNVMDFLIYAEYMEMLSDGIWHPDPIKRRTGRYRATHSLIGLCEEHRVNPYMITRYGDPEIIILRAKRKRKQRQGDLINYKDTPFTKQARADLEKINEYIAGHNINLDITDEQEEALRHRMLNRDDPARDCYLDFNKTRLRRIFNNDSFEQGGRFYGGWWQQIPGEYRHFITIDDEPTVELDFSEMHFAIMYAEKGEDIPMEDSYALEGYDAELRSHIKKAFNIIINCDNRRQAVEAIDGRIRDGKLSEELGSGKKLIDAFEETHPHIKGKIASGEGIRGQFVDSQIAEQILLKGMEIDLCILPIHDGFIMKKRLDDVLEGLMHEAIMDVIGHTTYIKPELPDLSPIPHVVEYIKYRNGLPDSEDESNGPLADETSSLSPRHPGSQAHDACEVNATFSKNNKERRDREWNLAHAK